MQMLGSKLGFLFFIQLCNIEHLAKFSRKISNFRPFCPKNPFFLFLFLKPTYSLKLPTYSDIKKGKQSNI